MNRRDALKSLAVASTVGVMPALASAGQPPRQVAAPGGALPPAWLLAPLRAGSEIGFGWRLEALYAPDRGAFIVELARVDSPQSERRARVHVCQHLGQPRGVAHTEWLDLLLMDGGSGRSPTDEELGRVVQALAWVMRQNELREGAETQIARLLTHPERVDLYASEGLL